MNKLAHIICVRSHPVPEIRETMAPVAEATDRVKFLQRSWETVWVSRVFVSKEPLCPSQF